MKRITGLNDLNGIAKVFPPSGLHDTQHALTTSGSGTFDELGSE